MSRLETSSESIRNQLISRNSYNPSNIYDINNSTVVDIINTTSRILRPGNGFDFSNTVIGRIVGPNTPIAVIGNQALANLYTSQVVSTLVRKNVPTINLNNLFNGKPIVEKNIDYSITKENPDNIQERIFSVLRYSSGINKITNPIRYNLENIKFNHNLDKVYNTTGLSKALIEEYTGKGQLNQLSTLLSSNIYSNNFNLDSSILSIDNSSLINSISEKNSNISTVLNSLNIIDYNNQFLRNYYSQRYSSKYYATSGNSINQNQVNQEFGQTYFIDNITTEDIVSANDINNIFTWGIDDNLSTSKGLLGYTNALFNTLNTNNNAPFNKTVNSIVVNGKTYYNGNQYRQSSATNQYNSISKTIRPNGSGRKNSTIKDSIIPQFIFKNETGVSGVTNSVMFSIENLAIDSKDVQSFNERGPNNGRIMWFMPSILDFTEDVSPNITSTNFLGRGEPVYTYANTERKLTISFYIVVDHVKDFIGVTNFADFQNRIYNINNQQINSAQTKEVINEDLQLKLQRDLTIDRSRITNSIITPNFNDLPIDLYYPVNIRDVNTAIGFESYNTDFENRVNDLLNKISNSLTENDNNIFEIIVKSSVNDTIPTPEILFEQRSTNFKNYIEEKIRNNYPKLINKISILIEEVSENSLTVIDFNNTVNSEDSVKKRKSSITSVVTIPINESENSFSDSTTQDTINTIQTTQNDINTLNEIIAVAERNELFDYKDNDITTNTNGSFNKVRTRTIQNGFMSYTPEDLYKRLTFLHQCTRQGRSQLTNDNNISNAVFGKPPVIVFKLGDMYNTKAMITSLNLSFENELPWDLNPEGFGVQKMGCKVTMNLNLIGASTIERPKSHILNGESRRFYANSSYEPQAGSADILDREEQ